MARRPLVPVLTAFTLGVLAASAFSGTDQSRPIILTVLVLLPLMAAAIAFPYGRPGFYAVLALFFFSGTLLTLHKRSGERLLHSTAVPGMQVTMEGTVLEPPRHRAHMTRAAVRVDRVFSGHPAHSPGERVYVTIYGQAPDLSPGDKIRFPARLRPFRNFNNPGSYDYESAMRIQGYSCAASISDGRRVVLMGPGTLGKTGDFLEEIRGPLRRWIQNTLPHPENSLLQALILGEKQGIAPPLREAFQAAGLAHVLAVSGLHVGLVAWLAFNAIRWILSRSYRLLLAVDVRKASALITCVPVTTYALVAGFHVSTQRALIMVLAFLFSIMLGREKEVWSILCLAALLILAVNPDALFTISFQLSFAAVAGILWLAPAMDRRIHKTSENGDHSPALLRRSARYASGLTAVTLAAFFFLLPLTTYYFHRIPLVSLPANLAATPILGLWVLPLGLLSALVFPFFPALADLLLQGAALGAAGMEAVARFLSEPAASAVWVISPNRFEVAVLYAVIVFGVFSLKGRFRILFLASCLVLAADIGYWIHETTLRRDLRITYLDVGQGNSALVEFPRGKRMLIDGGGFVLSDFDVGRMVVAPYLWRRKIARIHTLVLSHPDADHMNGLKFIAENFSPEELWHNGDCVDSDSYRSFMETVNAAGITLRLPGDSYIPNGIEGVGVEVLHPPPYTGEGVPPGGPSNDRSLVLRLTHAGTSFLFPGDIGSNAESQLVARAGELLRSDVLMAPHHGSNSSSSAAFLDLVQPAWCIVSAGFANRFGFPHSDVLARFSERGIRVVRTDLHGAVCVTAGAETLTVKKTVEEKRKPDIR